MTPDLKHREKVLVGGRTATVVKRHAGGRVDVEFRVDGPWLEAERMEKVHRGPGGWSPLPPEGEL